MARTRSRSPLHKAGPSPLQDSIFTLRKRRGLLYTQRFSNNSSAEEGVSAPRLCPSNAESKGGRSTGEGGPSHRRRILGILAPDSGMSGGFGYAAVTPELRQLSDELQALGGGDAKVAKAHVVCRICGKGKVAKAGRNDDQEVQALRSSSNGASTRPDTVAVRDPRAPSTATLEHAVRKYRVSEALPRWTSQSQVYSATGRAVLNCLWEVSCDRRVFDPSVPRMAWRANIAGRRSRRRHPPAAPAGIQRHAHRVRPTRDGEVVHALRGFSIAFVPAGWRAKRSQRRGGGGPRRELRAPPSHPPGAVRAH